MSRFMIATEENMYALQHYGVKGMKWGHKNKRFGKGFEKFAEYYQAVRNGTYCLQHELKKNHTVMFGTR